MFLFTVDHFCTAHITTPTMWYLVIAGLVHVTLTSAESIDKRGYRPVEAAKLKNFTQQFRYTLLHLIETDWEETKPLVDKLNAEHSACNARIADMEPRCESCAKDECTPELHEVILKEAEKFLKKVAVDYILGTLGWDKITKFFEGPGKKFAKWIGWDKAEDFFKDLGKGIVHWDGWEDIGDSLEDLGKGIKDIGEDIGDGIKDFGEDVVDKVKDLGEDVEDGVKHLGKGIEDTVKDLGKGLEDGVKDLGKGLEDTVKDIGKGLEDGIKDIGKGLENGIKNLGKSITKVFKPRISLPRISLPRISFRRSWGKKRRRSLSYYDEDLDDEDEALSHIRREVDPDVRECMEKCASCDPFLVDEQTRIRLVCGPDFVQLSNDVKSIVSKIKLLYDHVMDDHNPIVSSVECDTDSFSFADLSFANVKITVFFEGGYRTYRTELPFHASVEKTAVSAALMAKEYYDTFMQR